MTVASTLPLRRGRAKHHIRTRTNGEHFTESDGCADVCRYLFYL